MCIYPQIAGAAAAAGLDLDAVHALAARAAASAGTLGVALSVCVVPGTQPSNRLEGDTAEVGMGIHGEQGLGQEALLQHQGRVADVLTERMLDSILGNDAGKVALCFSVNKRNPQIFIRHMITQSCCIFSAQLRRFPLSCRSVRVYHDLHIRSQRV
jgi:dihydroxyacetone kinase